MTQAVIVVGQTFTVTCETSLASLGSYSNPRVYYKRPDGYQGYLTPTVSGTTLIATVTPTVNPVNATWRGEPIGYPGTWRFYPYVEGSGTIVYRGQTDRVIVSKEYQE